MSAWVTDIFKAAANVLFVSFRSRLCLIEMKITKKHWNVSNQMFLSAVDEVESPVATNLHLAGFWPTSCSPQRSRRQSWLLLQLSSVFSLLTCRGVSKHFYYKKRLNIRNNLSVIKAAWEPLNPRLVWTIICPNDPAVWGYHRHTVIIDYLELLKSDVDYLSRTWPNYAGWKEQQWHFRRNLPYHTKLTGKCYQSGQFLPVACTNLIWDCMFAQKSHLATKVPASWLCLLSPAFLNWTICGRLQCSPSIKLHMFHIWWN